MLFLVIFLVFSGFMKIKKFAPENGAGWGVGREAAPPVPSVHGSGIYTYVRMYSSYIYICIRVSGHTLDVPSSEKRPQPMNNF